ncbi:MAG: hypothetical protein U9R74_12995, partial [Pseudomonadota bacterium]|nr:hypothetical protein [Pseudomonadota bacterium]
KALHLADTAYIDGAPRWYYNAKKGHACASGYAKGGMASVDAVKHNANEALVKRIDETVQAVIHEHFRHVEKPAERALIAGFETDPGLPRFIQAHARTSNLEYKKKIDTSFARACVAEQPLTRYQGERLEAIRVAVIRKYQFEAFDELDQEIPTETGGARRPPGKAGDPFGELEVETRND